MSWKIYSIISEKKLTLLDDGLMGVRKFFITALLYCLNNLKYIHNRIISSTR